MKTLISIIILIIPIIEWKFSPRLGFTRNNNLLLWYGKTNRKFIILF